MEARTPEPALKVAMVLNAFPVLSQTFILAQLTGLLDRGHEVHVFSRNGPAGGVIQPVVGERGLYRRWWWLPVRGPQLEAWARRPNRARAAWTAAVWTRFRLPALPGGSWADAVFHRRMFREYDVIHAQFGPAAEWVLRLQEAGFLRGPVVASIRGYDASAALPWDRIARVLPSSASLRGLALERGCPAEKCEVMVSGVDLERIPFRPHLPAAGGAVRALFVGRLVEKKGLDDALRAVALLPPGGPGLELEVVGDGPEEGACRRLAEELGLGGRVRFLGARSHPEVLQRLGTADLLLAPSRSAANDVEGAVNTVKEALAAGVPVVSTRHGGIPEVLHDGVHGRLVPERDPAALAGVLAAFLRDPSSWAGMVREGRRHMEACFDQRRLLDRLEAVYCDVARTRR